jgi:RimJ/RimL family protein N-acetyltransferase
MGASFNRSPVTLEDLGPQAPLFACDFAKLFIENFTVKVVDYGFRWGHIYDPAGFDAVTWWLFGKTQGGRLLGPAYAVTRPVYPQLRHSVVQKERKIRRLLIFFGGADSANVTGRCLAAFLSLNRPHIEVDVVIDDRNPHAASVREQVLRRANIRLHSSLPTVAPLMATGDPALAATDGMSWERLGLGLPALVVTLADNQPAVADRLSRQGLVRLPGSHETADERVIYRTLGELVGNGLDPDWWLRHCLAAVDGPAVHRVAAGLTVTATPLRVRRAGLEDETLLLEWVNDPVTRRSAFSSAPIGADTHGRWFRGRLADPAGHIYIAETAERVPVGQVRFDRTGDTWVIDYGLAPQFRGRRLGCVMLDAAMKELGGRDPGASVIARVKAGNRPSRRVFESLGFHANTTGAAIEYRSVL